ncbi:nicotinate (nicotinamide) nucleotide adenylyltransferase [Polynucleobacter ibericus]|uniref:nicotinate (nicotinamide) nucleotide adenylyltransferase n=1 Tax=Polynucleobacter ibericus TaxID=1819725 RepID=UPI001BFDB382|nr:nicotinate (nicotinamide) nucleotide adenylyltransferase [Polynucleobacter ibericus]QWE08125.1 nicotinate (nicotinamide) nucleotide adenylyltransferase [Polynucleobacter ibericus]
MSTVKKIGILGGTFDPPHAGHLRLASHFAKLLHLDALLLIPSGEPWQKGTGITPAETRLQLTEAAGIDLARAFLYLKISTQVGIDRIEIDRAGPSYAIDTVKTLRERFGADASLTWLMGADSLIALPSWNSWEKLSQYVNFAVATRPHHDLNEQTDPELSPDVSKFLKEHRAMDSTALENSAYGLIYLDESLNVDLSSTELRDRLKSSSRSAIASEEIPTHTLEIITKLGLYQ